MKLGDSIIMTTKKYSFFLMTALGPLIVPVGIHELPGHHDCHPIPWFP
jgi:hypothetical protein